MASIGPSGAIRHAMAVLAVLIAAIHFALPDIAQAELRKLALVIGNDAYEHQPALAKAVGDAHAMRAALEKLGFEVRLAENLGYGAMVDTLADFQASISPGDTVAFHFSGHGVAANGRNYLLPVDFPVAESGRQGEVTLPRLAFDAGEIVDGLRAQGAALTLAVFDACRDNALTSGTRSIGMSRGLVRMDPPRGVFVMFSAGPGELAADRLSDEDRAETSVFTRVFIPILETPGLTLVEVAKRTQVDVSELAATVDHQQFPDYSDRVIGDVVLMPGTVEVPAAQPNKLRKPATLPEVAAVEPDAATVETTQPDEPGEAIDARYGRLSGRDIWMTVSPAGKAKAALVEARLRAAGMNVMIDETEGADAHTEWDHDLDYSERDAEIASLVRDIVADLYPLDLTPATTREIPNITITPSE